MIFFLTWYVFITAAAGKEEYRRGETAWRDAEKYKWLDWEYQSS